MGRDPWRPPAPDSRGNPGAVLYETQKVAIVEMMGQTRGNFHRLVNTLGAVSSLLHPNGSRASVGDRLNREYGIRDIIVGKSLVLCTRYGWRGVNIWTHEEYRARSGLIH
jgi:hypothetical protein